MSWRRGQEPGTLDLLDDGVELMTRCWSAVGVLWLDWRTGAGMMISRRTVCFCAATSASFAFVS